MSYVKTYFISVIGLFLQTLSGMLIWNDFFVKGLVRGLRCDRQILLWRLHIRAPYSCNLHIYYIHICLVYIYLLCNKAIRWDIRLSCDTHEHYITVFGCHSRDIAIPLHYVFSVMGSSLLHFIWLYFKNYIKCISLLCDMVVYALPFYSFYSVR